MSDRPALDALRDQRDFLLASLEDLERERAAGDLDDADYRALKDDYTARAAAVLRALDPAGPPVAAASQSARPGRRLLLAGALVVLLAVVAGVLVARNAGRREAGQTATGVDLQTTTGALNEAGRLAAEGDLDGAIERYEEVLGEEPDNVEALTYRGWVLTLTGDVGAGLDSLIEAATTDPTYPDAHAFLAIVFFRNGLVAEADRELDRLDALDPPPAIRELVGTLRTQVDAALAATTTTVAP